MAKIQVLDVGENALLVRFGSELGTQQFIFGKDGDRGQPFMTQVGRRTKTLDDAFDSLMPKIVKEAIAQGLDVKRQGDWFFIPTAEPRCKKSFDAEWYWSLEGRRIDTGLRPDVLYTDWRFHETRHTVQGEIIFRCTGRHYVRGTVYAPDHPPLALRGNDINNGWFLAVRRNSLNWEHSRGHRKDD